MFQQMNEEEADGPNHSFLQGIHLHLLHVVCGATGGEDEIEESVLHKIAWRRIILDEAHSIKDRRCNTAQAVFALQGK